MVALGINPPLELLDELELDEELEELDELDEELELDELELLLDELELLDELLELLLEELEDEPPFLVEEPPPQAASATHAVSVNRCNLFRMKTSHVIVVTL